MFTMFKSNHELNFVHGYALLLSIDLPQVYLSGMFEDASLCCHLLYTSGDFFTTFIQL